MASYTVEPVHHAMCDVYLAHPGPCTCGLDALRARVAELEAAMDRARGDERSHVFALVSMLVYDSDGEPMTQAALLEMCARIETELFDN